MITCSKCNIAQNDENFQKWRKQCRNCRESYNKPYKIKYETSQKNKRKTSPKVTKIRLQDYPEYKNYLTMIRRCTNPNNGRYKYYGGRGIKINQSFRGKGGFIKWLSHIGRKPSNKHTQDRYPNPDGDYTFGNIRWATISEQNKNKRY